MDRLNVLITGSGAPGIRGTIYSLKNNYDNRDIRIVGTDTNIEAVGKYFCDKFYKISPSKDRENYLEDLNKIISKEKIDVVLPQNTSDC